MREYEFLVNGILHVILAASLYAAMEILREELGLD